MNAIVPVSASTNAVAAMTVTDVERVALAIARGGLFGQIDPNAVLTLCFLAQAEGQHPAVVFRDYHLIQGKPAKKAEAMLRDFVASGGKVEWHKLDDTAADATFSHPFGGSARIDWTMERAKTAGLATPMWKKYPRQMLRSRVVSEGVRTVYPGATSGLYVPEEVADMAPDPVAAEREIEGSSGPVARTKLEGPHTSKTALKKAVQAIDTKVRKAETIADVNGALKEGKDTLAQAERDWPELIYGNPDVPEEEGLRALAARRRTELTPSDASDLFLDLVESLNQCDDRDDMRALVETRADCIAKLDGEESRKFETLYDERDGIYAAGKTPLAPAVAD